MKLKFSINYHTAWGESLHVSIDFHSQDGTVRHQNLLMLTEDGELWTLETSALVGRQHPLSHIQYCYQVEDVDGQVLRKEWDMVPRIYYFDATKDYVFPDEWRDRPLPMHLYSAAYLTSQFSPLSSRVNPLRLPLFRRTILFRVSAPQLKKGQLMAVSGSHPAIGSWNTSRYLPMEYAGDGEWMLTVNAQGWLMPVEYKYVVVDANSHELVAWEEGDNRSVPVSSADGSTNEIPDGQVLVLYGGHLRLAEETWRAAGVAVPVFSLRSEHSYGVGDFGDLRRFVDWAVATGMKFIQLLPVNDTTTDGRWHDSYPYNIVSMFALHPHYVDLEAAGTLRSKAQMTKFLRRRQELNALPYSDYEAVERVKTEYLQMLFEEQGKSVLDSKDFKAFVADNEDWLKPYAEFMLQPSAIIHQTSYIYYVQYLLHTQLKAAADYAREKGVALKGDLPIGVNRDSVETRNYPELFNLDSQTGAPPDAFSREGQNWGFPTYHWSEDLFRMLRHRLNHMAQYFDALRIDHVLGFFRIWEIPIEAVYGLLGQFSPSQGMSREEIESYGLHFQDYFTEPFIAHWVVNRIFGHLADKVRAEYLDHLHNDIYRLKEEYNTQRKIEAAFKGKDSDDDKWIRDGLMALVSDVLFVRDRKNPDLFHPRIAVQHDFIYEALYDSDKAAFNRLYNDYFYRRNNEFWYHEAMKKLPKLVQATRMLVCAEDLGMVPDCVAWVMNELRILSLEIQSMPKDDKLRFGNLYANPYRSVSTISTHDMPTLRQWWDEDWDTTQAYFNEVLHREGPAPHPLPDWLAADIVRNHLNCPSMLCLLSLQDWLSIDEGLRLPDANAERINIPANPRHYWRYRMHMTIEQLMNSVDFNNKVKIFITQSGRK